jgi:hypothetical protein
MEESIRDGVGEGSGGDETQLAPGAEGVGFEPTRARALPVFKFGEHHPVRHLAVPFAPVPSAHSPSLIRPSPVLCWAVPDSWFADRFATPQRPSSYPAVRADLKAADLGGD